MRARLTLLVSLVALAACSPYDPDLGETPFRCGTDDPKCPDGYSCVDSTQSPTGLCVRDGSGELPDAGDNPNPADAAPFVCNNDSMVEPNDDLAHAWTTPIPTQTMYALATLAICPAGDVDIYRLGVADAVTNNLKATVTTSKSQGELILEILNGTGVASATGTYTNDTTLEVVLNNAPTGTWHVQVRGADGTVQNNYRLDILLSDQAQ